MTRRADLWFAVLVTALGLGAAIEAWRMPRLGELGAHPMSAPGLTPGLLGLVLAVLGISLLARSLRAPSGVAAAAGEGWGRFAAALALCLVYAAGLLGRVPFWAATALFVFAFILAFTWGSGRRGRDAAIGAALALAVAFGVTLLFERVFLVRLP